MGSPFEYAISNDTSMEDLKPLNRRSRKVCIPCIKKMKKKNIKLEDVRDVRAIRIIIPDSAGKDGVTWSSLKCMVSSSEIEAVSGYLEPEIERVPVFTHRRER